MRSYHHYAKICFDCDKSRGGGLMVGILAYYSDNPSSKLAGD